MGFGIPSFSDVKRAVTNTAKNVKDTVVDTAKDVKDTVVDTAKDAKNTVVDTSKDVFEVVKHNPVTDKLKQALPDPKDLARDALQTGLRVAYHGAEKLLPSGATDLLLKGTEKGMDVLADGSEALLGKDSGVTDKLRKLADVDLNGINRTKDPVTGQELKADWPGLWSTWLLEEKPKDLGTWDKVDGVDRVTVRDNAYTEDLAGRPHQQQMVEEFFKMYPNPKVGDVFPPANATDEQRKKALYVFTGQGTAESGSASELGADGKPDSQDPYTALEWFLGSYNTQVKCTGIDEKTGKPNLEFTVENLSHFQSGTRVPQSFQDAGLPEYLVPNHKRGEGVGIGGNWQQRYIWTTNGVDNPNK
ncbi:hypothetical protein LY474_30525 [Myxococcus stipitatus]|uniref:hypothetical protein n=1 Tax=Myxococcus stipitatus TaxID=83455 RepID=UPI001F2DE74A|nr:hypothetical protein [Myxococcus stipitatus]MCE9672151.1 hypothetical protein [Myxococcus stipitatus]